jgi:hypothetical protein
MDLHNSSVAEFSRLRLEQNALLSFFLAISGSTNIFNIRLWKSTNSPDVADCRSAMFQGSNKARAKFCSGFRNSGTDALFMLRALIAFKALHRHRTALCPANMVVRRKGGARSIWGWRGRLWLD